MKTILIAVIIPLVLLIGIFIIGFGLYVSNYNLAVSLETSIQYQYEENRNTLSNTTTRIMEMAQVNEMYKEDLKEIVEKTFTGRYGDDGSNSMWQWIQEQNPQLDPSIYTNLQATIESGRNEFRTSQTRLLDYKRQYNRSLDTFFRGFFMRLAGFPKINMDDYNIIIEDSVQQRFDNGKDEILDILGTR